MVGLVVVGAGVAVAVVVVGSFDNLNTVVMEKQQVSDEVFRNSTMDGKCALVCHLWWIRMLLQRILW